METSTVRHKATRLIRSAKAQVSAAGSALYFASFNVKAQSAGLAGVLVGWQEAVVAGTSFLVLAFLLLGVAAVGWGCKLIWDKSNDRADVKTSHIVVSLLGGSLMCALWFIIEILVITSGGNTDNIGAARSF